MGSDERAEEALSSSAHERVATDGASVTEQPRPSVASVIRRWPFGLAVGAYLACRFVTLAFLVISDSLIHRGLFTELKLWDGKWFLLGVEQGWPRHLVMVHGHVAASPIAFFPALPLLIRALVAVTGMSVVVAGVFISGATGLTAVVGVGYLTRRFTDDRRAARAALLFAVFPGSFAFSLIYSEGLTITFVAFGLLALLDRRWWLAGLLGALATASSPVGLAFVLSCAWCALWAIWRDREWSSLLAPILAPLGFVAWMGFLWIHTGNLMAWRLTERGGWNGYPSLAYPVHIITEFAFHPLAPTLTGQILFFGTVAAVVGIVIAWREHQPPPVFLYGVAAVVLAAISAPVGLRPRFLLLAFPLIMAVGTRYSGWRYRSILGVEIMLLTLMTLLTLDSFAVFP